MKYSSKINTLNNEDNYIEYKITILVIFNIDYLVYLAYLPYTLRPAYCPPTPSPTIGFSDNKSESLIYAKYPLEFPPQPHIICNNGSTSTGLLNGLSNIVRDLVRSINPSTIQICPPLDVSPYINTGAAQACKQPLDIKENKSSLPS